VNEPRARYCGNCGLSLNRRVRPVTPPPSRRPHRRSGSWIVLLILAGGILLGGLAVTKRTRATHRPIATPNVYHAPYLDEPRFPLESPRYRTHDRRRSLDDDRYSRDRGAD
jgi:hypothetical protein